jgi:hypothetical protein
MNTQSGLANADGSFNGAAAVAKLNTLTNNTAVWSPIIQSVVDSCITQGPSLLAQFQNLTNMNITCDATLFKAIEQCIKRQWSWKRTIWGKGR